MKVSFDFDGTLEYKPVMDYARELIKRKVKVYIVTARHHQFFNDVIEVADGLKIPHRRIIFTGGDEKFPFFKDNKDFAFHLDDDLTTTRLINERTQVKGVAYWANPEWKEECKEALKRK